MVNIAEYLSGFVHGSVRNPLRTKAAQDMIKAKLMFILRLRIRPRERLSYCKL